MLVALDYNHLCNSWDPEPPKEFMMFYGAFLAWRTANRWDNEIADHLPKLFHSGGLINLKSYAEDEVSRHGEPDFDERAELWAGTLDAVAGQLVAGGFSTERQLADARERYARWTRSEMVSQTLVLRAVTGTVT